MNIAFGELIGNFLGISPVANFAFIIELCRPICFHPVPSEHCTKSFCDKSGNYRFKDDWDCCHLIAEVLDPDGKVSRAQISNKLRQLGLKVAPRKKIRYGDEHEGEGQAVARVSDLHDSVDLEGSVLSRPL